MCGVFDSDSGSEAMKKLGAFSSSPTQQAEVPADETRGAFGPGLRRGAEKRPRTEGQKFPVLYWATR